MKKSTVRWVLGTSLVLTGIYLIVAHDKHLVSYLPFTILLSCFVMHLFMHGGHGGHSGHNDDAPQDHGKSKT
jgi:Protein of unknown function (DUF2933).